MTSANITDVSVPVGIPTNPYTKKTQKDAKEDFMALMAGSVANASNINVAQSQDFKMDKSSNTNIELSSSNDRDYTSPVKMNVTEKKEDIDISEIEEQIEEFSQDVTKKVCEDLGISEEELTQAMEDLGISFVDLTLPSNLAMLLKQINGENDSVNLLLDTSIKEVFDDMSMLTGELFEATGLDTEGLISVLDMEPVSEEMANEFGPILDEVNLQAEVSNVEIEENIEKQPMMETRVDKETAVETEETSEDGVVSAINSKVTETSTKAQNNNTSNNDSMGSNTQTTNQNMASEPVVPVGDVQNNFSQSLNNVDNEYVVPTYTNIDTEDVINQLVTQARVTITEQVRSMEMELNPQNLGKMLMQVTENEGQITARFITQNEGVKSALEMAITSLIEKLNEQGVKVDAVEVSVGTHEFEENLEKNFADDAREELNNPQNNPEKKGNRSRGGIHLGDPDYMDGAVLTEEEELTASMMRTYGNTINFKA